MPQQTERVLFVHAHPAREAIGCGGTIARLVTSGAAVSVLTATRGEHAPVFPDGLAMIPGDLEGLAELREREARVALGALGVTDHRFLGGPAARRVGVPPRRYIDSGARIDEHGRLVVADEQEIDALIVADVEEIAADVLAVMLSVAPTAVITDGIEGVDAGPDQVRLYQAVVLAATAEDIPVYVAGGDGAGKQVSVDVADQLELKKLAIASHASQCAVVGGTVRTSDGDERSIDPIERFRLVPRGLVPVAPRWPQPGGSLLTLVLGVVLSFLAGGAVGTLTPLIRATDWSVGGVLVPVGGFVGLAASVGLVLGLRLALRSRVDAGAAVIGMATALLVLTIRGFETVRPVGSGVLDILIAITPIVACAVIAVWPHRATWQRLQALRSGHSALVSADTMETSGAKRGRRRA